MGAKNLLADVDNQHRFWLEGRPLKNLEELTSTLRSLDPVTFSRYVNATKNDVYNWVRDIHNHKELAAELVDCTTRETTIACLQKWLTKTRQHRAQQDFIERVVKAKIRELNQNPAAPDLFEKARLQDPLFAFGKHVQRSHPKNIPNTVTVPRLWELKQVQKIEKKSWQKTQPSIKQAKLTELLPTKEETPLVKNVQIKEHDPLTTFVRSKKATALDSRNIVEKLREVYTFEI